MKILLIGGTPGTGKSSVASQLGTKLKRTVINLGQVATDFHCLGEHDDERDTFVIDEDCLVDAIEELLDKAKSDLIIEGHYIDLVPSRPVEMAIILRVHPELLPSRLEGRKYSKEKIQENLESEIFGVCQLDAIDAFGENKVFEIDSSEMSQEEVADEIVGLLKAKRKPERIDWMVLLEEEGRLDQFIEE